MAKVVQIIPEIITYDVPANNSRTKRRQTLHLTSFPRVHTSLGLPRGEETPLRQFLMKRSSLTPDSARHPSKLELQTGSHSRGHRKRMSLTAPAIKHIKRKSLPEPVIVHPDGSLLVPPGTSYRRGSLFSRGRLSVADTLFPGSRRKSKIPSLTEDEPCEKKVGKRSYWTDKCSLDIGYIL